MALRKKIYGIIKPISARILRVHGIEVVGTDRGLELTSPKGIVPRDMVNSCPRRVSFTDLDRNGHMNNTVYADLICDALPLEVWRTHTATDVILYYHKEVPMGESTRLYRAAVGENLSTACLLFGVVVLMMFIGRVSLIQLGKLFGVLALIGWDWRRAEARAAQMSSRPS